MIKLILALTTATSFGSFFNKDKSIFETNCGSGKLTVELASEMKHLAVGTEKFAQIGFKTPKKDKQIVSRYGYQFKGLKQVATVPESAITKATYNWNVVISSAAFAKEDMNTISKCITDNAAAINKVLIKTDIKDLTSLASRDPKTDKIQISSVSFLESVYSVEEAKRFKLDNQIYDSNNPNEFVHADKSFLRIALDNSVWLYEGKMSRNAGYIDSTTKAYQETSEGLPDAYVKTIKLYLKTAKNKDGKTILEKFK